MRPICFGITLGMLLIGTHTTATAALVVAGSLQSEQGDPGDWDPPNSSLIMADNGGGIHSITANNLADGGFYEFKVLDDGGTPPANWGDPEVVNNNTMAYGDADGSVDIWLDTSQTNGSGGAVVWVNSDNLPLQVVGNFMDEAGGAGDWNGSDPSFNMSPQGSGYYTIDLNISTPGSYEFKATNGGGFAYQVGADGFGPNAGTFGFDTTIANQPVTMFIDVAGRSIGVITIPEPSTIALCLMGLTALALIRRS